MALTIVHHEGVSSISGHDSVRLVFKCAEEPDSSHHKFANTTCLQYLPLHDFEVVTNALNFDTADCHVIGGCDLYTTKAASADKKLYKNIDKSLESQYASLLSFSASLSPPQASAAASALNLSRSSPFGPLSQTSSRRTFAYLIATLNASHPDYDFSHILRPSDFRREKSLKQVMNTLDTTLYNLRPRPTSSLLDGPPHWSSSVTSTGPPVLSGNDVWNPRMWRLIDNQMTLKECSIYCYAPEEDPYDGEEGAIWSFNYFLFNKARKRVCYIYLRGLSIISHSPTQKTPIKTKRSADGEWSLDEPSSSKRARYWLGDRAVEVSDQSEEDEELVEAWAKDRPVALDDEMLEEGKDEVADEVGSPNSTMASSPKCGRGRSKSTVRGMSEDIADSMEV